LSFFSLVRWCFLRPGRRPVVCAFPPPPRGKVNSHFRVSLFVPTSFPFFTKTFACEFYCFSDLAVSAVADDLVFKPFLAGLKRHGAFPSNAGVLGPPCFLISVLFIQLDPSRTVSGTLERCRWFLGEPLSEQLNTYLLYHGSL